MRLGLIIYAFVNLIKTQQKVECTAEMSNPATTPYLKFNAKRPEWPIDPIIQQRLSEIGYYSTLKFEPAANDAGLPSLLTIDSTEHLPILAYAKKCIDAVKLQAERNKVRTHAEIQSQAFQDFTHIQGLLQKEYRIQGKLAELQPHQIPLPFQRAYAFIYEFFFELTNLSQIPEESSLFSSATVIPMSIALAKNKVSDQAAIFFAQQFRDEILTIAPEKLPEFDAGSPASTLVQLVQAVDLNYFNNIIKQILRLSNSKSPGETFKNFHKLLLPNEKSYSDKTVCGQFYLMLEAASSDRPEGQADLKYLCEKGHLSGYLQGDTGHSAKLKVQTFFKATSFLLSLCDRDPNKLFQFLISHPNLAAGIYCLKKSCPTNIESVLENIIYVYEHGAPEQKDTTDKLIKNLKRDAVAAIYTPANWNRLQTDTDPEFVSKFWQIAAADLKEPETILLPLSKILTGNNPVADFLMRKAVSFWPQPAAEMAKVLQLILRRNPADLPASVEKLEDIRIHLESEAAILPNPAVKPVVAIALTQEQSEVKHFLETQGLGSHFKTLQQGDPQSFERFYEHYLASKTLEINKRNFIAVLKDGSLRNFYFSKVLASPALSEEFKILFLSESRNIIREAATLCRQYAEKTTAKPASTPKPETSALPSVPKLNFNRIVIVFPDRAPSHKIPEEGSYRGVRIKHAKTNNSANLRETLRRVTDNDIVLYCVDVSSHTYDGILKKELPHGFNGRLVKSTLGDISVKTDQLIDNRTF